MGGILGGGLEEGDGELVSETLGGVVVDGTLVDEITLVSYKELVHVLASISVNLTEPLLHVVERLGVSDVVHHDDSVGTAVVTAGDGTETLLLLVTDIECVQVVQTG